MIVAPIVKYRTLAMAKSFAPVDSGNLRHNAISLKRVKSNSWTIHYSAQDAYYIGFVEEGTKYMEARHFIRGTVYPLTQYLINYFAGYKQSQWANRQLKEALRTSENNSLRQLRHFESINKSSSFKWR